jgi:hypothetical protein
MQPIQAAAACFGGDTRKNIIKTEKQTTIAAAIFTISVLNLFIAITYFDFPA